MAEAAEPEVFEDCSDARCQVSVERLERGREKLQALELRMKDARKERFQRQKSFQKDLKHINGSEAELKKELEKQRRQHEAWRSVESRMGKKLQEVCDSLDAQATPGAVREAARLRRLEVQLEVLGGLVAAAALPSGSLTHVWGSDRDNELFRPALLEACESLTRRNAECAEAAAESLHLREGLACALLQQAKVELAQLDAALPPSSSCSSSKNAGQMSADEELRQLQRLRQELKQAQLSRRLELEAAPAASAPPTVVATPVAASATAPPTAPVVAVVASAAAAAGGAVLPQPALANAMPGQAAPPPMGKGKGKGKGKGAPKAPPPPPAGRAPPPRMLRPDAAAIVKRSNLLNLHWKILKEEPPVAAASDKDGGFLAKTADLAAAFMPAAAAGGNENSSAARILALEASRRAERRQELRLPKAYDVTSSSTSAPSPRDTVFSNPVNVKEIPTPLLEAYFKARTTSLKLPSAEGGDATAEEKKPAVLDKKFLQMLGIVLTKHVMAYKSKGETDATAVQSLKRAVLRCDYVVVQQQFMALMRASLIGHRADGSKVTEAVEKHGEAALEKFEAASCHRLVHELLKVPQINERLECMLFQTDFDRSLRQCVKHLEVLKQALEALDRKRDLLGKFFSTALKMGQGLNRDSRAPQAPRGFQLTSLEKLVQTKSTKSPKHNVLHFVLALMNQQDVDQLFSAQDIALLGKAKALKSYNVYQDCIELVQGFFGLHEICQSGNYVSRLQNGKAVTVKMERRRKTMVPGMRAASPAEAADSGKENEVPSDYDSDDRFHDEMKVFVDSNLNEAQSIAQGCFKVFNIYKDLAFFFDDVSSVWPPPRDENAAKVDLIAVFHGLAQQVRVHRQEIEQDGLRALVNPPQPVVVPCSIDASESDMSLPMQPQPEASLPAAAPAQVQGAASVGAL